MSRRAPHPPRKLREGLARMAFHADFWVVVGAASPVIMLAAVVSASDSMTINGRRSEKHPRRREYARLLYYTNA